MIKQKESFLEETPQISSRTDKGNDRNHESQKCW